LKYEDDYSIVQICRSAAQARLSTALDFVKSLRAEHLQSFWYSASKYNFVLLGTFIGILLQSSTSSDEFEIFKDKFEEYRWVLRLAGKSSEILDRAASILSTSIETLIKGIPEFGQGQMVSSGADGADEEYPESPGNTWSIEQPMEIQVQSPSQFSEGTAEMFWQGLHISSAYDNDNMQYMGQDGRY
jgi:hypothetical protein